MQKSNLDIWQDFMNKAYDKWDDNTQDMSAWFMSLTPFEKEVVAIGKFNQQVNNGGFSQWSFNGYKKVQQYTVKKVLNEASCAGVDAAGKALALFDIVGNDLRDSRFYAITDFEDKMAEYFVGRARKLNLIQE